MTQNYNFLIPKKDRTPTPTNHIEFYSAWKSQCAAGFIDMSIPVEWMPIVHSALTMMRLVNSDFRITQIKEKFRGLRLYWEFPFDKEYPEIDWMTLHLIVDWAESQVEILRLESE